MRGDGLGNYRGVILGDAGTARDISIVVAQIVVVVFVVVGVVVVVGLVGAAVGSGVEAGVGAGRCIIFDSFY